MQNVKERKMKESSKNKSMPVKKISQMKQE